MTAPYQPMKRSILDRLSERLFPTLALMDPQEGQAVGRQGLLQLGANLLQSGGASPQQGGTLANIGRSIAGVDVDALQKHAMQLQAYRQQQATQQQIAALAQKYTAPDNEDAEQRFDRLTRFTSEVAAIPGGEHLLGPLSNVLNAIQPTARDRGQLKFGVPTGSPPGTKPQLFRVYQSGPPEPVGLEGQEFTPYQSAMLGFQRETADRATEGELNSAALGANMGASHIGMRGIEDQNPQAVEEVAAMVRSGRVAGALPVVGPVLDEAIRAGKAPLLSPAARQLLAHLNSFVAAAVPDRGGKALTLAELKLFMDEFVRDPGDDPETARIKMQNRIKRIRESKVKGRRAWSDALDAFGVTEADIFGGAAASPKPPAAGGSWRSLDPDRKP